MSQLNRSLLRGNHLETVGVPPAQVTPVDNQIFILGGSNVSTRASANNVYADLDSTITIDSAEIGNIKIATNTISSLDTNGDITFDTLTGHLIFPSESSNSAAITDAGKGIISTDSMTDGQIAIGRTGASPIAATITAGANTTITNSAGSITVNFSGSGGGGNSGLTWQVYNFTGSGNRTYDLSPGMGIIANSTVGTFNGGGVNVGGYCPSSPIIFNFADPSEWSRGDVSWFINRNVGNWKLNMPSAVDYPWAYSTIDGGIVDPAVGSTTSCYLYTAGYCGYFQDYDGYHGPPIVTSGSLIANSPTGAQYFGSMALLNTGQITVLAGSRTTGYPPTKTYDSVFFLWDFIGRSYVGDMNSAPIKNCLM